MGEGRRYTWTLAPLSGIRQNRDAPAVSVLRCSVLSADALRAAADHAIGAVQRAQQATVVSRDTAEQLRDGLRAAGINDKPRQLNVLLEQLAETQARYAAALEKLRRLRALADEIAGDGASSGSGSPVEPPRPAPVTGRPPRPDMVIAARIRGHVGKQKTVGALHTADGRELDSEIWSGADGPGRGGPGLAEPWRRMETMTMHVEGHAAAVMRRDGHRDVVLHISRAPCDYQPNGCEARLRDVIPAGSRMTVYTVERGGGVRRQIYDGNGKGLA